MNQRQFAKRKARERKLRHLAALSHNQGKPKFMLELRVTGQWKPYKPLQNELALRRHLADTELARKQGQNIVAGRVIDRETGDTVVEISGSDLQSPKPEEIVISAQPTA